MKKICCLFVLLLSVFVSFANDAGPKSLKVLMIGNSFSSCLGKNLPQMVKSVPGLELELTSLYIGGCSFNRHWREHVKSLEDASYKPYTHTVWNSKNPAESKQKKSNLKATLESGNFDIITIQQASYESCFYDKYQPYADRLIAYVKKHNPNAEIVIHETWSYRADDKRISPEGNWKLDNVSMYEGLKEAYLTLAKKHKMRIIPVGAAVQITRELNPIKFKITPAEEKASYAYPDVPPQAGDVVGSYYWKKNSKSGECELLADTNHFNEQGEYLQSAVWFAILFERPISDIKYEHPKLSRTYCKFLQECAQKAVDEFKQVN